MTQFQHCCTSNRGNKSYISKITKIQSDFMSSLKKKKKEKKKSALSSICISSAFVRLPWWLVPAFNEQISGAELCLCEDSSLWNSVKSIERNGGLSLWKQGMFWCSHIFKFLSCTLKRKNKVMTSRNRVLSFKLSLKITEFQVCKRVKHPLANIGIYSLPLHINYFRPGPCILIISCSSFLNAF